MSGEIPGVREARDRLTERMKQDGLPPKFIEKKADEAAKRLDRNIQEGRVHRPR